MKNIPILILHGWNLSALKFVPLQDELRKRGYNSICIDLPGFGSTDKPKNPLYLSDYVKYVIDFLQRQQIKKVVLIGHSFGGRIGIKLASENPQLLRALILTGTPGITPVPRSQVVIFIFLSKLGKIIFSLPLLSLFQKNARKLIYRLAKASDFYNTDQEMRETFKNIVKENLTPYLPKINIPTLLLWGSEDKLVPVKIAEKMKEMIYASRLVIIKNARHGLPWTHPDEFAKAVEKFVVKRA